ncbi:MAG: class I SAM-dependent methyltransferase [Victivallales bacterium]|nr:class I SAM-dependent methyltransferase [Victivallales bacterium]
MEFQETHNQLGATFPVNSFSQSFIDFAGHPNKKSLDIGACYGVNTIPVLMRNGKITANDINEIHLQSIEKSTPPEFRKNLKILHAPFPDGFSMLEDEAFDAILVSHVLHFLNITDLITGIKTLYRLINPGGKVFTQTFSPFTYRTRHFIPVYQARKALGDPFPGYIEDCSKWGLNQPGLPEIKPLINYLDLDTIRKIFKQSGFKIEFADYIPLPDSEPVKQKYAYDNREWTGVIAVK